MLDQGMYAVYGYQHPLVRRAIWELKYHRHSELARALAENSAANILEHLADQIQSISPHDIIFVPIPTHRTRRRDRGFNQSALIAQWWSAACTGSSVRHCLKKIAMTPAQARLSRRARMVNVQKTMCAVTSLDPHKIYVIVDDVITTGATCTEATRALRAAGARMIYAIALAHGYA